MRPRAARLGYYVPVDVIQDDATAHGHGGSAIRVHHRLAGSTCGAGMQGITSRLRLAGNDAARPIGGAATVEERLRQRARKRAGQAARLWLSPRPACGNCKERNNCEPPPRELAPTVDILQRQRCSALLLAAARSALCSRPGRQVLLHRLAQRLRLVVRPGPLPLGVSLPAAVRERQGWRELGRIGSKLPIKAPGSQPACPCCSARREAGRSLACRTASLVTAVPGRPAVLRTTMPLPPAHDKLEASGEGLPSAQDTAGRVAVAAPAARPAWAG